MAEGLPDRPANIGRVVAINRGTFPLTMEEPEVQPLPPAKASRWMEKDPTIRMIDMREPGDFGETHVPGAINIPVSSSEFEQRVGWVFDPETPFLLLGQRENDSQHALYRMSFVGLDSNVQGSIAGGMLGWCDAELPSETLAQISVQGLHEHLHANIGNDWHVVDVREDEEWASGHIEGAHHINYKKIGKAGPGLPFSHGDTLAVICGGGMRSSTGASLLRRNGYSHVINVLGGMSAWSAADYEAIAED